MKPVLVGMSLLAFVAMTGFAQPQTDQPADVEDHPAVGHPMVMKPGADWPQPKAEDVASLESIVAAYYASTSGTANQPRDWNRFRSLFNPMARLIPARPTGDGGAGALFLSVDEYISQNQKYFEKMGFVDHEAARRVETFGNIAHVWSTYESKRAKNPDMPYARGIASIQLLKDNGRWWIMNIFWDYERDGNPMPDKYLETPKN